MIGVESYLKDTSVKGHLIFFNITRNPNTSGNCLDLCSNCNAELQEWVANNKGQVACNCTDEEK